MREIDEDELRKNRLWVDAEQIFDELHQHEYILSFPKVRDTAILYIASLLIRIIEREQQLRTQLPPCCKYGEPATIACNSDCPAGYHGEHAARDP